MGQASLESSFARLVPRPIRRRLMLVETRIEEDVERFAVETPNGARVLDAGAGEARHRGVFANFQYVGVDLAVGDLRWDYSRLDALADLSSLPFADDSFDRALNIVVLEHTQDPQAVIAELSRVMRPRAQLLLVAPHAWEVHQSPNDYFRFTRHGLSLLFERANLRIVRIDTIGGYFSLLARRLMNGMNFFKGGARWLLFPPAAIVGLIGGLFLPALDVLDAEKNFTLAYSCLVEKP